MRLEKSGGAEAQGDILPGQQMLPAGRQMDDGVGRFVFAGGPGEETLAAQADHRAFEIEQSGFF